MGKWTQAIRGLRKMPQHIRMETKHDPLVLAVTDCCPRTIANSQLTVTVRRRVDCAAALSVQRSCYDARQSYVGVGHTPATKLRAADSILNHTTKAIEIEDSEVRVSALEGAVSGKWLVARPEGLEPPAYWFEASISRLACLPPL